MRSFALALTLGIGLSAVAVAQQPCSANTPRRPLDVVLDFHTGRALIPEGAIVPAGLKFSGRWSAAKRTVVRGEQRGASDAGRDDTPAQETSMSFVYAYAPESAFARHRAARREAAASTHPRSRVRSETIYCHDTVYVYADHPTCGNCGISMWTEYCLTDDLPPEPSGDVLFAASYPEQTATYHYVQITSDDNYLNCHIDEYNSSSTDVCVASDYRFSVAPQVGTVAYADGWAQYFNGLYTIGVQATWDVLTEHGEP